MPLNLSLVDNSTRGSAGRVHMICSLWEHLGSGCVYGIMCSASACQPTANCNTAVTPQMLLHVVKGSLFFRRVRGLPLLGYGDGISRGVPR